MKELWVEVRPWKKAVAATAIESGASVLVVDEADRARQLSRVTTVAPDGDLVPGTDVFEATITPDGGIEEALALAARGPVIVSTTDWNVIPLENLVSRSGNIVARVSDAAEAVIAATVLERGVKAVLLATGDPAVVRETAEALRGTEGSVGLETFTVTAVRQVGMGDRVCVDTCTILADGQGMLIGNTSSAFLLVHAETLENPYVSPRPFRVNAGAVHAYALLPDGKTAYLSELKSGESVLVSDQVGNIDTAVVGRVKIERRPLLLVEAKDDAGREVSLVLQNAETIRLVSEDGSARSVVDLAPGDRVLGHTEALGRHFGVAVAETLRER